jgi:hypothetical protein
MVSMSPTSVFFMPVEPGIAAWDSPLFSTTPELAYLGCAVLIAISITAAYASSRSMMARLAPAGMIFIPCKDGISHNEIEDAKPEHITAGCNVLLHAMLARAGVAG